MGKERADIGALWGREEYGSVSEYLTKIGFGPEAQQRLARALAAPPLNGNL